MESMYPSLMKKQHLVLNEKDMFLYCPNCGKMSGSMTVKQNISIIENMKEDNEYSFTPQNIRFVEPIIECPNCKEENMVFIDYGLQNSIKALNTIPFIMTTNCCEGHAFEQDIRPYIQFCMMENDYFDYPLEIYDGYIIIEPKTGKEFQLPKDWEISCKMVMGSTINIIEHTTYLEDIKKFKNNRAIFNFKAYNKYKQDYLDKINAFCIELQTYLMSIYLEDGRMIIDECEG